jgi:hypothetical protein
MSVQLSTIPLFVDREAAKSMYVDTVVSEARYVLFQLGLFASQYKITEGM